MTVPSEQSNDLGNALASLKVLEHHLQSVHENVQPLLSMKSLDALELQLDNVEGSKANVALAFSLASLYFVQLNIHAKVSPEHPIHELLKRIKAFVAKLKSVEKASKGDGSISYADEGESSKRLKVDKNAVERLIKHQISS